MRAQPIWTELAFQVPDVIAGAKGFVSRDKQLTREPEPESSEPPPLAMRTAPEGNEFMLTRGRAQPASTN